MTDSPDLTPEQDAVRRLLADARHDGPTPPEVVARLDETLAALVADRSTPAPQAPVVDLASRRRRRIGTGVLAAAAVVVAGVALGQVLPIGQGSDDSGFSADSSAGGSADRDFAAEDDAGGDSSAGAEMAPQNKSASPSPLASQPTLSSSDAQLDEEVEALRSTTASSSALSDRRQMLDMMRTCALPEVRGRRVAVEVDGQQGLVVFERPDGAAQDVAIYVCGTPEPVRTLTLPAP
ncbi:hypothetical protein J2X46_002043 [Nocardioides sp. BE266]|uniref:hypothetical protein n=1 Tax=Nocardioides sp. BE266 TaxID=2817725 RepID=UPI0028592B4B|nr:hypothetical protein [Nocardioides sp. BE266]MDR7253058.1 hypothetical protein [Nocardioides sp. BE266]